MSIGEKRSRIRIEQRVESGDGQGGTVASWALRDVVWANDRPMNGRETLMAGQVTSTMMVVLEIWSRDDISVKDRVRLGSRTLDVTNFYDPDGMGRELYLLCAEVQGTAAATGSHDGWIDSQLA